LKEDTKDEEDKAHSPKGALVFDARNTTSQPTQNAPILPELPLSMDKTNKQIQNRTKRSRPVKKAAQGVP